MERYFVKKYNFFK